MKTQRQPQHLPPLRRDCLVLPCNSRTPPLMGGVLLTLAAAMQELLKWMQHFLPTTLKLLILFERIIPAALMGMGANAVLNLVLEDGIANQALVRRAKIAFVSGVTVAYGISLIYKEPDIPTLVSFLIAASGKRGMMIAQRFFLTLLSNVLSGIGKEVVDAKEPLENPKKNNDDEPAS